MARPGDRCGRVIRAGLLLLAGGACSEDAGSTVGSATDGDAAPVKAPIADSTVDELQALLDGWTAKGEGGAALAIVLEPLELTGTPRTTRACTSTPRLRPRIRTLGCRTAMAASLVAIIASPATGATGVARAAERSKARSGAVAVGIAGTPAGASVSPWFQPPAASPLDLRRDRLVDVLLHDAAPVTLVCAPAGFGKTSLLANWAAQSPEGAIAWLSLDRHDNDPGRLWSGLLGALRATGRFPAGSHLHDLLAPPDEVDPGFVDQLLQEVASLGRPLWLVLDDVEVVRHPRAIASLELLLRRSPSNLHLVLSGRAEPPIGLPRLRVRGALKEVRTADLAFTLEETADLVRRHEVWLSDTDLKMLHSRTDGWAAGLQIACMAVASGEEPGAFVARFDGDDHQVADYLLSEVMDGLPDATRRFMLRTSICADLSVGLAERLSDRMDAARVLNGLEQRNAFTRRVGRGRATYRYHELLRTFLLTELRRGEPRAERELQHTAARWFQQRGDHLHAMEHLAMAGDTEQVVQLARSQGLAAILSGRSRRLHLILAEVPEPDRRDPVVALLLAAAALELGNTPEADRWLVHLDLDAIAGAEDPGVAVLAAAVGTARARFDLDVNAALMRLETTPAGTTGDPDLDLYALHHRGVARVYVGSYQTAVSDLERATMLARADGRDAMLISALSFLAGAHASMGDLSATQHHAAEAVTLAEHRGWGRSQSIAHAYMLLGWMASLRGDTETAQSAAARAVALLAQHNEPDVELAIRSLELYLFADHDDAFDVLQRYLRLYERLADADVSPALLGYAAPVVLQVCLDLGERQAARRIAEVAIRRAPDPGEPALLRALLQFDAGQPAAARRELSQVLDGTATCHLVTTEVRAWLLAAAIEQDAGNITLAGERLRTALLLAEPVELLQPFTESRRFTELLIGGKGRFGRSEAFVDRILERLPPTTADESDALVRLTPAELEILRDLPSLLTVREIAEARTISMNTVKSHLRAIYRKLDVDGRRSAVETARSRGLL
jgi:LuxR family transcriptional regulator, maltose regulon positive regulatory protein